MKKIILILALLITTISHSQWNIIGNIISGEHENDNIGISVSVNGDGTRAAVYDTFVDGDSRGRVRVFELQNDTWVQIGNGVLGLIGDGTSAGNVMLSEDGTRYVFSSPLHLFNGEYSGAVRVFELQNDSWNQIGNTIYGEDAGYFFGEGVAINADGNRIICGSSQSATLNSMPGFANVYQFQNGNWEQMGASIEGEAVYDQGGKSVSINNLGNRVAVAFPGDNENGDSAGKVRVFEFQNNSWNEIGGAILGENPGDSLGSTYEPGAGSIQLNSTGNRIVVGSMFHESVDGKGQIRIFELQNNNWTQIGNDITGDSENVILGHTVSFNETGNIVAIGDPLVNNLGEIKVFKLENNLWIPKGETISGNGEVNSIFGWCTDINNAGDILITSEFLTDTDELDTGKVTVYKNNTILSNANNQVEAKIRLFPNPNKGNFSIKLSETYESVSIHISDILGKQISDLQFLNTNEVTLTENLSAGIYFVKVQAASSESTFKMIVE